MASKSNVEGVRQDKPGEHVFADIGNGRVVKYVLTDKAHPWLTQPGSVVYLSRSEVEGRLARLEHYLEVWGSHPQGHPNLEQWKHNYGVWKRLLGLEKG